MSIQTDLFYKLVNANNPHGWGQNQAMALAEMVAKLTAEEVDQFGDELHTAIRDGGFSAFCAKRRSVLNMGE